MPRKALLVAQGLDGWIKLDVGKGCLAVFRAADYYAAIARGKALLRAEIQAQREAQAQAMRQAETLEWIDTDTGAPL